MTDLLKKVQTFLKDNKDKILRLLPVLLIVLALPLTVIFSLNQQNFKQHAASTPDCNNGLVCTICSGAATDNCSYGNGTQSCTYTTTLGGQVCKPVVFNNVICYQINCSSGYSCTNQTCIKTAAPAARLP